MRDVEPGELLVISDGGLRSLKPFPPAPLAHCVFEHVYFARPDSYVFGQSVNEVRTELGPHARARAPARRRRRRADSRLRRLRRDRLRRGSPASRCAMGLIRNHYVGRTFIQPQQSIRHFGVRVKLNPVRSILEGKRVVLVDDSLVRGTTSRKIVKMVRAAGASEVHLRISCPPTISPCFYGVDTPSRSELIAATHTLEEIRKFIDADTLGYLSLDGLLRRSAPAARVVLHVLLHRHVSGRVPARRAGLPAARAESHRVMLARIFAAAFLLLTGGGSAVQRQSEPAATGAAAESRHRQPRQVRRRHADRRGADGPARARGSGGSCADGSRCRALRRLRPLSRARPALGIQRSKGT